VIKRVQVPVLGGLRKSVAVGQSGTTIAGYESQTLTLAQLKALLGVSAATPTTPNTITPGASASLVPGPGLAGGGGLVGSVPLYLTAPIPAMMGDDGGGGGGDGDPGPPGRDGVAGAAGPMGPAVFFSDQVDGEDGWPGMPGRDAAGATVRYGVFADSTNQANPVANAANIATINTTLNASGVSIVGGSKITFTYAGTYQISAALQFQNTGTAAIADLWLQQNGVNVAGTDQETGVQGGSGNYATATPTWIVNASAGDYVQIVWASSSTSTTLAAQAAAAPQPDSPSVFVNVSMLISATPGAQGPQGFQGSFMMPDEFYPDDMPIVPSPQLRRVNKGAAWISSTGPLTTGVNVVFVNCPVAAVIRSVKIVTTGGNGNCIVDVRKAPFASFPPTAANSIAGSSKPTISGGATYFDGVLNSWNTSISAGDVLAFSLSTTTIFTSITIVLEIDQ
jgi:hypothetical protein